GDTPLGVGLGHEGQQRANPHVKSVGDGEADEKNTEQYPPDPAERGVVEQSMDHDRVSLTRMWGSLSRLSGEVPERAGLAYHGVRTLFDRLQHQPDFYDGKDTVDRSEADDRQNQIG